jgi:hypothetical protein
MSIARFLPLTTALFLLTTVAAPIRAGAQVGRADVPTWEGTLTAPEWPLRARAVRRLSRHASAITATGLTRLIDLLRSELDGTASHIGGENEDGEAYSEYIMTLTHLVARFNDPRATSLLARQGIALTNSSVFQVAMAGDAGIAPLVATWNENEHLRDGVIVTMGQMRFYADSTQAPLSAASRATIDDYLLRASAEPAPWVRQAFVDAVETIGDPVYLPIVSDMSAHDTATINGKRYVARNAGMIAPVLLQRREATAPLSLFASLQAQESAACRVEWLTGGGICNSLSVKLTAAARGLARGQAAVARNVLDAFLSELTAQRGKAVNEHAYILLAGNAQYLMSRL